jgi:hypothetical protein
MKKRRGNVLKRLCRSSYYCGSRNSDRENPMKTEEHLEPTAVFIQRVTAAVSELKDHLQQDYERTYPGLGEIIRIVLDEEEAKAWELSFFPHLFLPDMLEAHIVNLSRSREHRARLGFPVRPNAYSSTRSSPPQSDGSESKIVSESVHGRPHGSRNEH